MLKIVRVGYAQLQSQSLKNALHTQFLVGGIGLRTKVDGLAHVAYI